MRIPRFQEAVQIAREQGVGLYLDIKTKGIAPLLLEILEREGMLERVVFGGEWEDVRALYPNANHDAVANINPGCNATQVTALQRQGKFVVANFSANAYEMNLDAMREAVAAGVDALNVDYPRLGADAVDRPVEAKLAELERTASEGPIPARLATFSIYPTSLVSPPRMSSFACYAIPTTESRARQQWPWSSLARRLPHRSTSMPAPHQRKQLAGMQRGPSALQAHPLPASFCRCCMTTILMF
jgi:hypothetical protein